MDQQDLLYILRQHVDDPRSFGKSAEFADALRLHLAAHSCYRRQMHELMDLKVSYDKLTSLCKATEEREREALKEVARLRKILQNGRDDRWAAVCGSDERGFQPTEWVKEAEEALEDELC